MNKTAGVLTTRKIRALLDSKRVPSIANRADLAAALSAAGSPITVHGVDAWFKHTDSNYALARRTLDSEHPSYAVPKGRWSPVLRLFGLTLEHIEVDDAQFRKRLFADTQLQRGGAQTRTVLARCWLPGAEQWIQADAMSLEILGFEVVDIHAHSRHSDWSIERRLAGTHCGLLYLNQASLDEALAREVVDFARSQDYPLAICTDGEVSAPFLEGTSFPRVSAHSDPHALNWELCTVLGAFGSRAPKVVVTPQPLEEVALVTHRPSIAVLPFADFTGADDQQQLGLALAEDITTLLSRVPELFVVSSSSTRGYHNNLPDTRTVRDQLGVRYVLEGSIRQGKNQQLRITAQLVDAVNRRGLWGERYEQNAQDTYAVLDELSVAICAQLEPRIRLSHISEAAQQASAPAWQLCQEGWMWLYVDAPQPRPERSLELFAKALEQDPGYPLAHAGMAVGISTGILWGGELPNRAQAAKAHAQRAYQQLPQSGAALYAMAMVHFIEPGNLAIPLKYLKEAVAVEPSNAMYHAIYGYLLAHVGQVKQGLEQCRYAMRLSPVDARETFLNYMLGSAQIAARDFEAAINTMKQCLLFDEVDFVWLMIAYAHLGLGQPMESRQCLAQIKSPRPLEFYLWAVEHHLWMGHERAEKEPFLDTIRAWGAPRA
ncbi:MAG: hypothetical protein AB8B93_12885 [Pseudomonadales bacterium]